MQCTWLNQQAPFFNQSEAKPKPTVTYLNVLSCALAPVTLFASSSDWFICRLHLFGVARIINYFGFNLALQHSFENKSMY